jgi:hypothetical protein
MMSAFLMLYGVFAIGFIEKTIQINSLDMSAGPITAAGQLIPLVIGAYALFITVMALLKNPCFDLVRWALRQTSLTGALRSSRKSMKAKYRQTTQSIKRRLTFHNTELERPLQRPTLPESTQERTPQEAREDGENDIELGQQSLKSTEGEGNKIVQEPGEQPEVATSAPEDGIRNGVLDDIHD